MALQPIERFYRRADAHPERIALLSADGARTLGEASPLGISYGALRQMVDAIACGLQALDPTPGSRVGICAKNSAEHLIALLSTYAAGKVWVPLSPRNGRAELHAMLAATRPAIVISDVASMPLVASSGAICVVADAEPDTAATRESTPSLIGMWRRFAGGTPAAHARGDEDAQIIKFSGGSTGAPKPVVQSVRCLHAQADGLRDFFEFADDDVNLIAAPLTHGASCFVLPILERGGRHVMLAEPKAPMVLAAIAAHGVTTMYAPPTLLYAIMEQEEAPREARASLRHVIYSAAPMTPERIRECQRFFGPVVETAYGQVEAPQIISGMRAAELLDDANLTSVGRPSPVVQVGIMSPNGELQPDGEEGEIVVRGPLLMSGYLDRADETARALVDGWLHTGDVGLLDARGYLFIRGRLRETINSGGFKIFPGDVDASLQRHPAVAEAAAFGMDDAKWGEAVHAAVVLAPGAVATAEELIAHVKQELGSVKAPKRIWWLTQLERNAAGKVSRAGVKAAVLRDA